VTTNTCINGAPSTCPQYLSDITGCLANTTQCTYNYAARFCTTKPVACSNITVQTTCLSRSDCNWNATAPVGRKCITVNSTQCSRYSTAFDCTNYRCIWDMYMGSCFGSLGEVTAITTCSTWNFYSSPDQACTYHGCAWDSISLTCLTKTSIASGNTTSTTYTLNATFRNPRIVPNTLTFQADVWLPNQLYYKPAIWYYLMVGDGLNVAANTSILAPSACNNIASFNASVGPSASVYVPDPVALQSFWNTGVLTNNDFRFFNNTLRQIIGPVNVSKGLFVSSVTLDPTQVFVQYTMSMDLSFVSSTCAPYGASALVTSTGTYYSVPLEIVSRDSSNNYVENYQTFYVSVPTTGTIVVGVSSPLVTTVSRTSVALDTSTCPSGQGLLAMSYLIQSASRNYAFVGPRNASDIAFTSPLFNNSAINCYSDTVTTYTRLGCANFFCFTQITVKTACRALTDDGDAFNSCTAPFTAAQYGKHDLFLNTYSCTTNATSSCRLAVMNPLGLPDQFPMYMYMKVYGQQVNTYQFNVFAGLLPYPSNTNPDEVQVLTNANASFIDPQQTPTFNSELRWNGVLTFVAGMRGALLQARATLNILNDENFQITPLDPYGAPLANGQMLFWGDVFPYMTYTPRAIAGQMLPILRNNSGIDGFSIPVLTLRGLMPANGYSVQFAYSFQLPSTFASRRHTFSTQSKHTAVVTHKRVKPQTGSPLNEGTFAFKFFIDDFSNTAPLPDLGDPAAASNFTQARPIKALQLQMHTFVDTALVNIADAPAYLRREVPRLLVRTYNGLTLEQITNVDVIDTNGNQVLSKRLLAQRHLLAFSPDSPDFFVTFVIIPSATNTSVNIFNTDFTSANALTLLSANTQGVSVTQTMATNVLTTPPLWYIAGGHVTVQNSDASSQVLLFVTVVVLVLLFFFVIARVAQRYMLKEYTELSISDPAGS
jgi:hypothetical protein